MFDTLADFFGSSGFMPHGYCFLWTPSLLWTYIVSESTIAISYFSIPFVLWFIVKKRPDFPFRFVFVLFGAFVLACGATHLSYLWDIWHPDYWVDAGLNAVTGIVSAIAAIILWAKMPRIVAIPTHAQLERTNRELQSEVARREQTEAKLQRAHAVLEQRVAERTAELGAAYKSLRASEERYRAITQTARVAVVTSDSAGTIVGWNRGAEFVFGYTEAEATGQQVTSLMPQAYHELHRREMNRVASGDDLRMNGTSVELIGVRKDEREFPMELALAKWETNEGRFFTGIIHDISERKRAEQAVRDSEEGLRAIFEGALDGIMVADPEGRRFLSANPAICGMLGYTHEELTGLGVADIHREEDLPRVMEDFERLARGEIKLAVDLPMTRSDGSIFYADVRTSHIRLGGKACVLGIFRDNTERKLAETALSRQRDLYNALSQTNQMIVRGITRDALFDAVCRIAVEHGRFLFVWIGWIDVGSKRLKPAAKYGEDAGYVDSLDILIDDAVPAGRNRTAQAVRSGTRLVLNDFTDPSVQPPSPNIEAASRAGARAYGTFPIRQGGAVAGTINFYATEAGFFTDDLVATLDEIAVDVSFALDNLEREAGRKRAEQELGESEERFRSLTELSSDWYWEQDEEFRLTRISDNEGIRSRLAARPTLGAYRWDLPAVNLSGEDWARHRAALERHEMFRDFEIEVVSGNGGTSWISLDGEPVFDPDGQFRGYRGIGRNITDRKRSEAELARLAAIVEGSYDAIMSRSTGGKMLTWNTAAERMFGYSADEVVGTEFNFLVPAEELEDAVRRRALIDEGRVVPPYDAVRLAKGGRRVDVSITMSPVSGASGELAAVSYVMQDIAARKRAEAALRAAEEQFRGLVEQSLTGIYIIQGGEFAYVNTRFAEIFGYTSAEELIGNGVSSLIAERDRSTVMDNIRRRVEGEVMSINYEFTGVRKDGSMIDVGVHGSRASHNGRPAVIGVLQDISERKRVEEERRRYIVQLEEAFMSTVDVATTLSEMRDPYTAGHERRAAEIAVAIGTELGFDDHRLEGLRVAGCLHDIGKVNIPSEILAKPGKLSAIEMQLMRGHPQASYDVLKSVAFPWPVAQVALQHHERLDGSGYPRGLKGEAILLEARIMAVADVMEAMSSHRPYRAGLGIEKALTELQRGRGTAYDADAVDACLRLFREQGFRLPN